ncbi:phBC6A51 family helix-turn-helix protein [Macrococcus capreoli]|uniref:phBC6A51 family helix-turn-helix protein n=1 Tax=Macrococcus capreoli TaxID=2982690 RepID=UPI0021D5C889|nr:phBC6A51 family helix-turn-helix protein [Macrococcus sp. TMW 2.2395]MCU7556544.1 phBC6A51 family helix-turn-helix protein [Macrococcus sp. TMW 2.2395]
MTMSSYDTLSEKQKEVAELMVENAIERRTDKDIKKLTQAQLGEAVDVTDRTIRTWQKDPAFLAYLEHLSRIKLQAAMPDFIAALISNLERGQNLSTKQLDLMATIADWKPDPKSAASTINVQLGASSLEERIAKLEERKKTIYDASPVIEHKAAAHEAD